MTQQLDPDAPQAEGTRRPRKRRRVFLWFFLAVQAVFIIWLIAGLHSAEGSSDTTSQAVQYCSNGGWQGLFSSYADCVQHYGGALAGAKDAGTALGAGVVIALWAFVDVILGITYMVVRLSRRSR
jgi:hypothetical protein